MMNNFKQYSFLSLFLFTVVALPACFAEKNTTSPSNSNLIVAEGRLEPVQVTSFMYGSHLLFDDSGNPHYALTSKRVDLTDYEGETVRLKGHLKEGYPVDNGPPYLVVTSVDR